MDSDAVVRRLAENQNGIVTDEQLRSCGLSAKQIRGRREAGQFVRQLPGVFRVGGVRETFDVRLRAVSEWMGETGFFYGATAAYILRLDGVERRHRIAVSRYSTFSTPEWLEVHRVNVDDRPSIRRVDGFRVPVVERVLLECLGELPIRKVGRALDDALRRRLTTLDRLWAFLVGAGSRRRNIRTFRLLLSGRDDRDERVRSRFESKMLTILRRIRGLRFLADFEIVFDGSRYVLDFYCPEAILAIECHSFRWHMGKHNSDARRDRWLRARGIEVIYFTWDDVCFHAGEVEREIRAALDRRLEIFAPSLLQNGPHRAEMPKTVER